MEPHATHHTPEPVGRRRGWRVALALGIGLAVSAGVAAASGTSIDGAATAQLPAQRIFTVNSYGLPFPIKPTPMCEFFNNFGAYSKVNGSGGHQGVDIGAQLGQDVYAVESGVLYAQGTDPGGSAGLSWRLQGDSGTQYRYYHLSAFAEGLSVGNWVAAGQLIGFVGDTGNATPGGWHLHFEVRPAPDYQPVDPAPRLAIPSVCHIYGTVTPDYPLPTVTTSTTSSTTTVAR